LVPVSGFTLPCSVIFKPWPYQGPLKPAFPSPFFSGLTSFSSIGRGFRSRLHGVGRCFSFFANPWKIVKPQIIPFSFFHNIFFFPPPPKRFACPRLIFLVSCWCLYGPVYARPLFRPLQALVNFPAPTLLPNLPLLFFLANEVGVYASCF